MSGYQSYDKDRIPVAFPVVDIVTVRVDPTVRVHDVLDQAQLQWWLPVLGPSAAWTLAILATGAPTREWQTRDVRIMLGNLSPTKFARVVDRLIWLQVVEWDGAELTVPRWLPSLAWKQLSRMPEWFEMAYRAQHRAA